MNNDIDNDLIKDFMPLVKLIANGYRNHPVVRNDNATGMDDILQLSMIGAYMAIKSHDSTKGPLGPWIKLHCEGEIKDYLKTNGCIVKRPREFNERVDVVSLPDNFEDRTSYSVEYMNEEDARKEIRDALDAFDQVTAEIVSMRFGIPNGVTYSAVETGDALGLSPSQIRRKFNIAVEVLQQDSNIAEAIDVIT